MATTKEKLQFIDKQSEPFVEDKELNEIEEQIESLKISSEGTVSETSKANILTSEIEILPNELDEILCVYSENCKDNVETSENINTNLNLFVPDEEETSKAVKSLASQIFEESTEQSKSNNDSSAVDNGVQNAVEELSCHVAELNDNLKDVESPDLTEKQSDTENGLSAFEEGKLLENEAAFLNFNDIEVNLDNLTDEDLNAYLSDMTEDSFCHNILTTEEKENYTESNNVLPDSVECEMSTGGNTNYLDELISELNPPELQQSEDSNHLMQSEFSTIENHPQNLCDNNGNQNVIIPDGELQSSDSALVAQNNSNELVCENRNLNEQNDTDDNSNNFLNGSLFSEEEQMLGKMKPFWIPDNETQMCMHCDVRFTVLKRRHHCRACGKVLCSQCCSEKAKLAYLDYREGRVCQICASILIQGKLFLFVSVYHTLLFFS